MFENTTTYESRLLCLLRMLTSLLSFRLIRYYFHLKIFSCKRCLGRKLLLENKNSYKYERFLHPTATNINSIVDYSDGPNIRIRKCEYSHGFLLFAFSFANANFKTKILAFVFAIIRNKHSVFFSLQESIKLLSPYSIILYDSI